MSEPKDAIERAESPGPAIQHENAPGAEEITHRCRHLRTKMMFVTEEWAGHVLAYPSSSAAYWCLTTMGPAGPDEGLADLGLCQPGRSCWKEG